MDVSFAFFADQAAVPPDGKIYVLGGGFSALALPQLPGRVSFAVVAGFRFLGAEAGRPQVVEMRFLDSGGKLVLPPAVLQFQTSGPIPEADRELTLSTVTYLSPMFGEPGIYSVELWSSDRLLSSLHLTVQEQQVVAAEAARPN